MPESLQLIKANESHGQVPPDHIREPFSREHIKAEKTGRKERRTTELVVDVKG